ncbi:anti-sigma factor family protein [Pelomonas aquatica]|jgi:anti-sigma factor RsiW|uniref:Anti-sigma factor n=1 Tax=Pelomonas aquatica TaxID=431058 RepID=A0A9X4LH78_9BURK|nr:anti-sigma factor [Pelomonas aquatica]MCY4755895.1 anti-sigma factor [Pelomonas aquatica]MDG0863133.1 anti-sigma factor [Pelomonas aquatica]
MSQPTSPTEAAPSAEEARLHAFVDDQLSPEERVAVLEQLAADPEAAARVAQWKEQRQAVRALARDWPLDETPADLGNIVLRAAAARRWRAVLPQALAAGLLLALGLGGGYQWGRHDAGMPAMPVAAPTDRAASVPEFAREAGVAFAVYSSEKRHPVEVSAVEQAHLVQWLSKRLGRPLKVPVLTERGYALLGGRLLPGDASQPGSPRAQFMYENADGDRLTLYVAVFAPGTTPAGAEFRLLRQDGRTTLYWADGDFGYALSAQPSVELQPLAQRVHQQLTG